MSAPRSKNSSLKRPVGPAGGSCAGTGWRVDSGHRDREVIKNLSTTASAKLVGPRPCFERLVEAGEDRGIGAAELFWRRCLSLIFFSSRARVRA
jgi:hypothetical protein